MELLNNFELTSTKGDKKFVRTNMDENTMENEVLDFISTHGSMDIMKFIDHVNHKGRYKIMISENQNPSRYTDGDMIDRAKLWN